MLGLGLDLHFVFGVRVRVSCFVVTGGHKGVLCVRQRCGRRVRVIALGC